MIYNYTSGKKAVDRNQIVTGTAKRGLIADPNCTYLKFNNLTCEFSTTLKFGPNISLTYHYC